MKAVYRILKAIDVSYENQDFDLDKTLNLEKLEISEHRLDLILEQLKNYGYLEGINSQRYDQGGLEVFVNSPYLTLAGMDYLEMDSTMQKIQVELTNPEEIAPELKGIEKILTSHVEILDEIRFLEADKMTIMKEKLIKLREEDKEKKIPWDSLISLVTTIGSSLV
jgi:ribosomal protein S8